MQLARLKLHALDTSQYLQISRTLHIAVLLKAQYCPILMNREINSPFWIDFLYDTNTLQLQNSYATEATSPAYPQNAATRHSKKIDSRQGCAMELQTPQACYNQARTPNPSFPKSNCHYVVGTIWGNVRTCFGCKHEFLPASAPDNQFVLVRPKCHWYLDKQSKALGRK